MFKAMRRANKLMEVSRVKELLEVCEYGNLAVLDLNGYPYVVPVNYVYYNEKIYIHCAHEGWKLDAIESNNKVSFSIVGAHKVVPAQFTSSFESVICFGKANLLNDETYKIEILKVFIDKYSFEFQKGGHKYVGTDHMKTTMIEIEIEHKSGKSSIKKPQE